MYFHLKIIIIFIKTIINLKRYDWGHEEAKNQNFQKIWSITLGTKDLSIDIDPRFFEL